MKAQTEDTMKALVENIGQTRYVLGYMVQASNFLDATISVFQHKKEVSKYLANGVVANMGDISLLHGTLTTAMSIPDVLHDNIDIFLVIPSATADLDSFIIQCADLDYLQKVVTTLITQKTEECEELDSIIDDIVDIDEQVIEELYVLYGYEIELQYSFDSDSLDAEIVEEAKKIYKKIEAGQE
jgi:hypothetical protein